MSATTTINGQILRNHFPISKDDARKVEVEFALWALQFNTPVEVSIIVHDTSFDVQLIAVRKRDVALGHFILGIILSPYISEFIKTQNQPEQ